MLLPILITTLTQPLYRELPGQAESERQPQDDTLTLPLVIPLLGIAAIGGFEPDDSR